MAMIKWCWLLINLLFSSQVMADNTIRISTSEWPPYISKKSPNGGYISQVIKEAFEQVNINVEFVYIPWARAYEEAKFGNFNATSYWYEDDRHKKHFYLSDTLSNEKTVFFRLKSDKPSKWANLSEFEHLTMGLTRGYTYTKELWQYAEKNSDRVSIVITDEQNFKMLLLERIDITPSQEVVGWHYLHNMFAKEQVNRVEIMQPPLSTQTGHLLFPKTNKNSLELLKQFNKGLSILKENGRIYELKEKLIQGYYSK